MTTVLAKTLDQAIQPILLRAPIPLLSSVLSEAKLNNIIIKRERIEVHKLATAYVTRVKVMYDAFHDHRQDASTTELNPMPTWEELFKLEVKIINEANHESLPYLIAYYAENSLDYCTLGSENQAPIKPNSRVEHNDAIKHLKKSPIHQNLQNKTDDETNKKKYKLLTDAINGQRSFYRAIRKERAVDGLRLKLLLAAFLIEVPFFIALISDHTGLPIKSLAIAVTFGVLGAFTSVLRRLQGVETKEEINQKSGVGISILIDGSWSLYLALASGAVFGAMGLFIFGSGLLKGIITENLIPKISDIADNSYYFKLAGYIDTCKMAVWAFIFGFAEKFIPDLLNILGNGVKKDGPPNQNKGAN
ncbi:hypothetical protein [Chromobacterium haemolyticum]|uniref:hypothetical protein n=1 Tax=Chromobacterium haemolyticum TaxID=394935 RepID=UPI000A7AAE97|nr:hypothetical protein [Chromobacterium haemolyticum]BBH14535.1 hypothetical protein CH06BL_37830 [Chromobacterium haemolyticum]